MLRLITLVCCLSLTATLVSGQKRGATKKGVHLVMQVGKQKMYSSQKSFRIEVSKDSKTKRPTAYAVTREGAKAKIWKSFTATFFAGQPAEPGQNPTAYNGPSISVDNDVEFDGSDVIITTTTTVSDGKGNTETTTKTTKIDTATGDTSGATVTVRTAPNGDVDVDVQVD